MTATKYEGPYSSLNAEIAHVEDQINTREHLGYVVVDHKARLEALYVQRAKDES